MGDNQEEHYERIGRAYGQMTVYQLRGEDVLAFLADMKVLAQMTDDEIKGFIDFVSDKLEIPFMDYFGGLLLEYLAMRGVTRSEITDERTV